MEIKGILEKCDHTLLRVDCTAEEIRALCDQGIKYHCASVCIPPCHVAGAKRYVGDKLTICTVIGFPNGYSTSAAKAFEAADAVKNGADEIDMVINLSMVKDGCWDGVEKDIRAVREATQGKMLIALEDGSFVRVRLEDFSAMADELMLLAFQEFPKDTPLNPMQQSTQLRQRFFDALPAQFDRSTYLSVAQLIGIRPKTAEKTIAKFREQGLILHEAQNKYLKR